MGFLTNDANLNNSINSRSDEALKNWTDSYMDTIVGDYAQYLDGSPTKVTYYHQDVYASTQDGSLDNVQSLFGVNSAKKYQRIKNFVLYNVDTIRISNQIGEFGLISEIGGSDATVLPNTIKPLIGDVFTFEINATIANLKSVVFKVTDVQLASQTEKKFYKITYEIEQTRLSDIEESVSKELVFNYSALSNDGEVISEEENAVLATQLKNVYDYLLTQYVTQYYDEDMDSFVYTSEIPGTDISVWCPYLQRFLHDNKIINFYRKKILEEIYVNKISEPDFRQVFSERKYHGSLLGRLSRNNFDSSYSPEQSNVYVKPIGLDYIKILPFYNYETRKYMLASFSSPEDEFSIYSIDPFCENNVTGLTQVPIDLLSDKSEFFKYHDPKDPKYDKFKDNCLTDGCFYYYAKRPECPKQAIRYLRSQDSWFYSNLGVRIQNGYLFKIPNESPCSALTGEALTDKPNIGLADKNGNYKDILKSALHRPLIYNADEEFLINIIVGYCNNYDIYGRKDANDHIRGFSLTDMEIKKINDIIYDISFANYYLIPMILFIIRSYIEKITK